MESTRERDIKRFDKMRDLVCLLSVTNLSNLISWNLVLITPTKLTLPLSLADIITLINFNLINTYVSGGLIINTDVYFIELKLLFEF